MPWYSSALLAGLESWDKNLGVGCSIWPWSPDFLRSSESTYWEIISIFERSYHKNRGIDKAFDSPHREDSAFCPGKAPGCWGDEWRLSRVALLQRTEDGAFTPGRAPGCCATNSTLRREDGAFFPGKAPGCNATNSTLPQRRRCVLFLEP
jgi:hypothetical protein